jgi:simple sugar transport system permease protein
MLNTIVFSICEYLATGPWKKPRAAFPRTPDIQPSAHIPRINEIPLGFFIAVAAALAISFFLTRTTSGFRIGTVGANRFAAHYGGISVTTTTIVAMGISGALAGLGGAIESLGVVGFFQSGSSTGLGFDGITIALLAKVNPRAVIPSAILIGAMRASNTALQSEAKVAPEIIDVVVAVILLLVAAPMLVRWILRIKGDAGPQLQLTSGWGSS